MRIFSNVTHQPFFSPQPLSVITFMMMDPSGAPPQPGPNNSSMAKLMEVLSLLPGDTVISWCVCPNSRFSSLLTTLFSLFNYFLSLHLWWWIPVAHHLSQVLMTSQLPFHSRNCRFCLGTICLIHVWPRPLFLSPNCLILDEAMADDNLGKMAACGFVYAADHDFSCCPQSCNDGVAVSFPWQYCDMSVHMTQFTL